MKRIPNGPAAYSRYDALAIKAVAKGNASEAQQRRAMQWIVQSAAMTYDETFVAGQPDVSANLQGRRYVGLQIVKLINTPIEQMKFGEEKENTYGG